MFKFHPAKLLHPADISAVTRAGDFAARGSKETSLGLRRRRIIAGRMNSNLLQHKKCNRCALQAGDKQKV